MSENTLPLPQFIEAARARNTPLVRATKECTLLADCRERLNGETLWHDGQRRWIPDEAANRLTEVANWLEALIKEGAP